MLVVAVLLATAAMAQSNNAAPTPQVQVVHRTAPPPPVVTGDHASIPIDFVAGLPTFMATIGGKPFRIGFDTGAPGGARLTDRVVQALALGPIGEAMAGDPSGKNLVRLKLYPVNDLNLGSLTITNWIGTSAPALTGKLAAVDCIIGLGAFDGFVVVLDYAGKRLLLDRGELPAPDGKSTFAYGGDMIPVIPVTIEGRTIQAHLDTGNVSMPLIVPTAFADQLSRKSEVRRVGVAHTISNTIEMKAIPVEGPVMAGTVSLSATAVAFPSVINLANVGSLALGNLRVQIDPKNHRIRFIESKVPSAV